ncbi:MAG TPA: penicillin acylase family protein [Acetobacteraceae bacterium]|nr:penicillin acylase family protein [Acetobacteraceae bacterium]
MSLNDSILLAALRRPDEVDVICRATGMSAADFASARDALLKRHAAVADQTMTATIGAPVEIKRDRAGVPHVFADSSVDLFFGLGVAMSQDRLWQMDRLRRRALGRQAEILGPAYVAADIAHLTVGIDIIAARDAAAMDEATLRLVAAFVAGINRHIETAGADLPIEFRLLEYAPEPFSLADIVAIGRGIWWSLNGRIDRLAAAEAARLLPTEHLRQLYLTPEASENLVAPWADGAAGNGHAAGTDDATGSNNWAIDGQRSGTGSPILCGDPHQPFWVPSSWYEFALHGPEDHAAGAGHPGLPGMWWGSNGTTAWSITNNAASTRDLYREKVDPTDPGRYREGDGWRAFDQREVSIPVRGQSAHALVVRSTVRGPVVNTLLTPVTDGGDPPLSLRWVGAEHLDDLRATVAISRARDWPSFRDALRDWSVAVFNWVYADRNGNIGYQMAGRVPIRGRITYGFRDADNPADQWAGYIPFDELPSGFNPPRGYVASANQRIVPPDFRYPIYGAYSQGHRGVRIDEAFAQQPVMDRAANIRFQNDVKNSRAARLCPHILRHLAAGAGPEVAIVTSALRDWDYRYDLASTAPTIFESFMARWVRTVLAEHMPARLLDLTSQQTGLAATLLEDGDDGYFAAGVTATLAAVAKQTVAHLREHLGANPATWRWERVHIAHWRHPLSSPALRDALDIGPAPVDGGSHTVRNTGGELPPHHATSGAEYRIVVDFTAPESFQAVQNIGNSGVPGSAHYRDQFAPWLRGEYHVVHLHRDRVQAVCEETTNIQPG